jgi:hypothetical protein
MNSSAAVAWWMVGTQMLAASKARLAESASAMVAKPGMA